MKWIRMRLLRDLGIIFLCLTMLAACAPRLVLSTAHLKDNIFDHILKDNITSTRAKYLERDMYKELKEIYKINKSINPIIDYFIVVGGHCDRGEYIICKYQNEERTLIIRFLSGAELVGGGRYTWIFKAKNSTPSSGNFKVHVSAESLIP